MLGFYLRNPAAGPDADASITAQTEPNLSVPGGERGTRRGRIPDTAVALRVGRMLHADYITTGTIIQMSESVVIFARVLGAGTGDVLASSQVSISRGEAAQESDAD